MKPAYLRSAKPALIIGSVAIDRVATPFSQSGDILGGAASYAAIAASYFAPTRLVGVVGGDFPKPYLARVPENTASISAACRSNRRARPSFGRANTAITSPAGTPSRCN